MKPRIFASSGARALALFVFRFSLFVLLTCPLLAQEVLLSSPLHYRGFDPALPLLTVQGSGNQTGNITEFRDRATGAPVTWMDFNGRLNAVSLSVVWLNKVCYADQMPQATAGAKIAACIAALPVTGGTVDARGLEGAQTITQNVFAGVTKPVKLLLGAGTYTVTVAQVITVPGTSIEGLGRYITNFSYAPAAGTAITITIPGTPSVGDILRDFSLSGPGKAVGATSGIVITDGLNFHLANLRIANFSVDGLAVTGDVALGTNTNMGSGDTIKITNIGTNGVRIEGNNSNVLHFVNMDVTSSVTGVYFKASGGYPTSNFFQGHVAYNTTNLLVESHQNHFKVYLENNALTTWHIDLAATSGYNTVEVLCSSDAAKYRDLGVRNSIRRNYALWQTFPTDPTAGSQAGSFQAYPSAIAGANALDVEGVHGIVTVRADNTQNWSGGYGLSGLWGAFNIAAGAVGTVTNAALFRGISNIQAGTVTNWYGSYIHAPTVGGTGAITNKWSYKGAAGAGIAEIADGITSTPVLVGALPAAAAGNAGWIKTVSDSTAIAAEGQVCAGAGAVTALAFSNGTVWKCF